VRAQWWRTTDGATLPVQHHETHERRRCSHGVFKSAQQQTKLSWPQTLETNTSDKEYSTGNTPPGRDFSLHMATSKPDQHTAQAHTGTNKQTNKQTNNKTTFDDHGILRLNPCSFSSSVSQQVAMAPEPASATPGWQQTLTTRPLERRTHRQHPHPRRLCPPACRRRPTLPCHQ